MNVNKSIIKHAFYNVQIYSTERDREREIKRERDISEGNISKSVHINITFFGFSLNHKVKRSKNVKNRGKYARDQVQYFC